MKKVLLVSLGCAKNLVDSEMILAMFPRDAYVLTTSAQSADLIIINTCGFIESAKTEAIDTILSTADLKENNLKMRDSLDSIMKYIWRL